MIRFRSTNDETKTITVSAAKAEKLDASASWERIDAAPAEEPEPLERDED